MSAPGKLETWQQQRAKINAAKEATKIVSKPLKEEPKPSIVELVETPVEVNVVAPVEVVDEIAIPEEIVQPEVEETSEEKIELKPITKKNKTKE